MLVFFNLKLLILTFWTFESISRSKIDAGSSSITYATSITHIRFLAHSHHEVFKDTSPSPLRLYLASKTAISNRFSCGRLQKNLWPSHRNEYLKPGKYYWNIVAALRILTLNTPNFIFTAANSLWTSIKNSLFPLHGHNLRWERSAFEKPLLSSAQQHQHCRFRFINFLTRQSEWFIYSSLKLETKSYFHCCSTRAMFSFEQSITKTFGSC